MLTIVKPGRMIKSVIKLTWLSVFLATALSACNNGISSAESFTGNSTSSHLNQELSNRSTIKLLPEDREYLQLTSSEVDAVDENALIFTDLISCGFKTANQFMEQNGYIGKLMAKQRAKNIMTWLVAAKDEELDEIETFTRTFEDYETFMWENVFFYQPDKDNDKEFIFNAMIGMSPTDVVSYIKFSSKQDLNPVAVELELNQSNLTQYKNAIIGVSKEARQKDTPYNGLAHWLYIDKYGDIWSGDKRYSIKAYLEDNKDYNKIVSVIEAK